MSNFIKDIANIKLTKIAKENNVDYSNIYNDRAKKEDTEKFEKSLRKEILISLVKENLSPIEQVSLLDIRDFLNYATKEDGVYTIDQTVVNSIYVIYKLFEE